MSNGSFRRALLDLDRELASVPYAGERDVRTLVARRRIAWRLPALALAAAVALLLFMRARDHEPVHVAGFTIEAPESSWQTHGDAVEVVARNLELDVPGFGHVVAQRGARVSRIDGGIHLVRGRIDVAVTHRPAGAAPALVRVSHGTIAVLGTRFTIEQSEHGGHVVLHEGRIRFDSGERSVILTAGSSLTWPLGVAQTASAPAAPLAPTVDRPAPLPSAARVDVEPVRKESTSKPSTRLPSTLPPSTPSTPPPSPSQSATPQPAASQPATSQPSTPRPSTPQPSTPQPSISASQPSTSQPSTSASQPSTSQPSTPHPTASHATAVDVDRLLAELANLRARRRFADAAALLERALIAELPIATLERLSYELGDIQTYQLLNTGRACRHWQSHRARFPQGRYTEEIAAAVRRLGCEETTP